MQPPVNDKAMWRRHQSPRAFRPALTSFCKIMDGRQWRDGRAIDDLARRIAARMGVPPEWVILTDSCTSALACARYFLEARSCPALTYSASYGDDTNLIDVDEDGWPVQDLVSVGVDLWGRRFPGACSILDAAHNWNDAPYHGEHLTARRLTAVCYSFGPLKEVAWTRGGALVVSPDSITTEAAEAYLNNGFTRDGRRLLKGGIKGLMLAAEAGPISKQMQRHDDLYRRRQRVLSNYEEWLGSLLVTKPGECSGHLAVLRFSSPGHALLVEQRLKKDGIEVSRHYPVWDPADRLPGARDLSQRILSIPCHAQMQDRDCLRVVRSVQSA